MSYFLNVFIFLISSIRFFDDPSYLFTNKIAVAALAFGSRPRQGGCKVAGLIVDPGVTSHAPGSAKSVRE
jgi:hypothetical protein